MAMSSLDQLQVNARIEIRVDDPDYGGKYFSRIMDLNQKEIKIMAPAVQGTVLPIPIRTPIQITFIGERALYSFDTIITSRFNNPISGFTLKMPSKMQRIQRREFVRLEVKIQSRYRIVNELNLLEENPEPFNEGYILDISGGGIRFCSDEELEVGSYLEMMLDIEPIQSEILLGRIVRCFRREEGGHEIGVAFLELTASVQDQIISWIFDKERDLRRKGFA